VSNRAHGREPLPLVGETEPGFWKRTHMFLKWFFAPRPLPSAWTAPAIFGSRYPKARADGAGLRQAIDEARTAQDGHNRD
jgi:hypothetical protein